MVWFLIYCFTIGSLVVVFHNICHSHTASHHRIDHPFLCTIWLGIGSTHSLFRPCWCWADVAQTSSVWRRRASGRDFRRAAFRSRSWTCAVAVHIRVFFVLFRSFCRSFIMVVVVELARCTKYRYEMMWRCGGCAVRLFGARNKNACTRAARVDGKKMKYNKNKMRLEIVQIISIVCGDNG